MNNTIVDILGLVLGAAAGASFIIFFLGGKLKENLEKREEEAEKIIKEKQEEADKILIDAKESIDREKEGIEQEFEIKKERIAKKEESLKEREESLLKRENRSNEIKLAIASSKEALQAGKIEAERIEKKCMEELAKKTGKTVETYKEEIINGYKRELEAESSEKIINIENNLKENANKTAKKLIVSVLQRLSSPTSVETRSVLIKVPRDFIKGKIVGKNGANIIEFEKNLDVTIVFNDLPNTISISCFNLVNRRIAEKAIEKLINVRGDINKEVVKNAIREAEKTTDIELYAIGKKALEKMDIKVEDKELVRIIGRLQYRTSYGQNIMKHSMEVAWIATMLGSELGLDVRTCKIGGFLHDLGKAIDQNPNIQGAHDYLTKELMEKYKFSDEEVHAAWTHHDSEAPNTPEALIVKAADAVSACRLGARQESMDRYVERLQALEKTVKSFDGIKSTFAISAGREIRIMVDPEKIDDQKMLTLAESVAHKIEEDLSYPGTIKVNVIRKTQHVDVAK
jgi:ribonuclease Y